MNTKKPKQLISAIPQFIGVCKTISGVRERTITSDSPNASEASQ